MEREIGSTFEYQGKTLTIVENSSCSWCIFFKADQCFDYSRQLRPNCAPIYRQDRKSVVAQEYNSDNNTNPKI